MSDVLLVLFAVIVTALAMVIFITVAEGGPMTCGPAVAHVMVCHRHPIWYDPPARRQR